MTGKVCHSCNQPLPELFGITADDDRGEIRFRGRRVLGLTSREFGIFRRLLDAKGRAVSKAALLDHLYQLEPDDEPDIKIIDVFVCKLRKKLAPLGLEIGTAWGRGYYVAEPDPAGLAVETVADTAGMPRRGGQASARYKDIGFTDGLMRDESAHNSGQKEGV